MPNPIKYNTSVETLSLKKGNFWIGTGAVDKGPTSITGFYNGITPPSGGYTIYTNKTTGGPSIRVAANDAQLISITNSIAGASYTTVNQCFTYYDSQSDKFCVNQDYPSTFPYIVLDGLFMYLDGGVGLSYPGTGTDWTDINGIRTKTSGVLINGPTYNSANGGFISFDGSNDYVLISNSGLDIGVNFSIQTWVKINRWGGGPNWDRAGIASNAYTYSSGNGFWLACTSQNTPANNFVATVGLENFFLSMGNDQYCVAPTAGSLAAYRNSWFNIGVRCNGNNPLKCYINGVEPASYGCQTNGPSSYSYTNSGFYLGNRRADGEYLDGSIASFMMYNRALSDSEFLQNFNAQKSRFGY